MRSYEAARSLFSFVGFCAWCIIIVGVLVALVGAGGASHYGGGAGLLAMSPGISISIAGLLLLAFVQMGRAGVDTAEYTQQMLKIARDQLEISQQSLSQGNTPARSFSSVKQSENTDFPKSSFADEPSLETENLEYKGRTITKEGNKFIFAKMAFNSIEMAQQYIDQLGVNKNAKPIPSPRKP